MLKEQLLLQWLPLEKTSAIDLQAPYRDKLIALLSGDLDFHEYDSSYASHNYHSFPAKFPPQLPRKFIHALTKPGDTVLDPMSGSGTTVLEAHLSDRKSIGIDIDPLALLLAHVKTNAVNPDNVNQTSQRVMHDAAFALENNTDHPGGGKLSLPDPLTRSERP